MLSDLLYALRRLLRTPGFTGTAILTLALGLATSALVFAMVDAVLLKTAGSRNYDDVYEVGLLDRKTGRRPASDSVPGFPSYAEFRVVAAQPSDPIIAVASWRPENVIVRAPGRAGRLRAERLGGDVPTTFRVAAQVGRLPNAADAAISAPVAAISDRLWREWFAGDRTIVGRQILTIDEHAYTVVGVAPFTFRGFAAFEEAVDVWMPRDADDRNFFGAWVRARTGASVQTIEAAARDLFPAVWSATTTNADLQVRARKVQMPPAYYRVALATNGFGLLVLVAACANLANMLYARGTGRAGEVSVRLALGGTRRQILQLFFAETVILAVASTVLAAVIVVGVVAYVGDPFQMLQAMSRPSGTVQLANEVVFDLRVLGFIVIAGVVSALTTGLTTAWRASRMSPNANLPTAGVAGDMVLTGAFRRRVLVAVQVTAAVLLLLGTSAFLVRLAELLEVQARFDTSGVTAARVDLSLYHLTPERGRAYFQQALASVRAIDGVELAAVRRPAGP